MTDAAGIKAAGELYSLGDIAKHFGVSKTTVWNVLHGVTHAHVDPAPEPPNIVSTRVPRWVVEEDWPVLRARGLSKQQAAKALGVSKSTLHRVLREVAVA